LAFETERLGMPMALHFRGRRSFNLLMGLALMACVEMGCGAGLARAQSAAPTAPPSPYLEDLTTQEVSAALVAGKTTIIIPVGGTEQNGPHMALGKHNLRAHLLAGQIAAALGDALVAPVLAYVPEGSISPPTEHMRFAGTISISEVAFKGLLESAARSFAQHGFVHIVLLGDHGGYQKSLQAVADVLNQAWRKSGAPARAHFVPEYYRATQTTYVQALKARGLSDAQIGQHAGTADTSLQMALAPAMVKPEQFALAAKDGRAVGALGDPRPSTAALGALGVQAILAQTIEAITRMRTAPR
jgi:creatinine amidohydrolase